MAEVAAAPVVTTTPSVIGAKDIPVFTQQTVDTVPAKTPAEIAAPADGQKPAGEATAESQPVDETTESTGEHPEKRAGNRRFERKLDKAYRERAEARARAEFLEKQLADLNKPKEQTSQGAPRLEDFTDVQEYAKAYAKYESGNAVNQYKTEQQQQAFKQAGERLAHDWEAKASKGEKKYDDFDDVVGEISPTNPIAVAIMQAENGEDIAYYLGTHRQEAMRIAELDPLSQARAIGRIEAKLLAEPPKAKTPSQAPAPITPVTGKSAGASDEPLDTDDINTWMKKANAKSLKAIGA